MLTKPNELALYGVSFICMNAYHAYSVFKDKIWSVGSDVVANVAQPVLEQSAVPAIAPAVADMGAAVASAGLGGNVSSVAGSVLGFVWDSLPWQTKVVVGVVGLAGAAYLANRIWKGNGVHVTNNNHVNINLNLSGLSPDYQAKVVREDDKNGVSLTVAVEPRTKEKFQAIVREAMAQQKAGAATAA